MSEWTAETIKGFFDYLNKRFGTTVNPKISVEKENRYPLSVRDGKLIFIPDFFNAIDDVTKKNVVVYNYSLLCIDMNPIFMAKGICNEINLEYLNEIARENRLRPVRRKLFKGLESVSVFKVGYKIRVHKFESYEITHIEKSEDDVLITVKPIGSHLGEPDKIFSEEVLYNKLYLHNTIDEKHRISVRRNIFVVFDDCKLDNLKILNEIAEQYPQINTPVIITTNSQKDNEHYHLVSLDDFYNRVLDDEILIRNISKNDHYGITFAEIDKLPEDEPIVFVAGTGNRQNILSHYPFSTTILIQPKVDTEKTEYAKDYDYVIIKDAPDKYAKGIIEIIKK